MKRSIQNLITWFIGIGVPCVVGVTNLIFPQKLWPDALWSLTVLSVVFLARILRARYMIVFQLIVMIWMVVVEYATGELGDYNTFPLILSSFLSIVSVSGIAIFYMHRLAKVNRKLAEQANIDSLTGLLNRRLLHYFFDRELNRSKRYGHVFTVIILDIDLFKRINDEYGHMIGDKVLQQTSAIIESHIRKTDVAFRYGGEEFVILLPETPCVPAYEIAEKLRNEIGSCKFMVQGNTISWTISLGVAGLNPDDTNWEAVLQRSDNALYNAKQSGRNRSIQLC